MVEVRYVGPVRGAHMLARELSDAGFRASFPPPVERRGAGHEVVSVLMRLESDVEAGVVGGAAFAAVQRIVRAFKECHPQIEAEAQESGED